MALEQINNIEQVEKYPLVYIAIGIQIVFYLIDQVLNYLQLTYSQKRDMPKEIKYLGFTEREFVLSQVYSFDKLVYGSISSAFSQGIKIVFLLGYLNPFIWDNVSNVLPFINKESEYQNAFGFLLIHSLLDQVLEIPFNYFQTFTLEQRYGFNKTTLKTFITDIIKTNIISQIITAILLFGYLQVVEYGGKYFYFYALIFVLVVIFLMMLIYPNFIAPLFNKYEELPEGDLKNGINKLAEKNEFPLTKIYSVDGSARSSHSNAYFFGFGKNKRIVLFDTLINQLNHQEIYAVLCHEIGHWKYSHTFKHLGALMIRVFTFFYLFSFVIYNDSFFVSFGYSQKSVFIGTYLFVEFFVPINTLMNIFTMTMSRRYEFQADNYAFQMGYAKQLYVGLIKMFKENASNLLPHPIYSWYHYSHPPLKERLEQIENLLKRSN
ncbi:hypothetical protein ABPG72_011043 [Tetrahymena utriculariae]